MTAAAGRLGRSLQSVSRAIAGLETELGVELVRRTTRRLRPTPAGSAFYQRIKAVLADIDTARLEASRETTRIAGVFRIGASVLFAPTYVMPAAVAFLQRFPDVEIELVLSNTVADLIEDRLDIAIRIGDLSVSSLKARRIAWLRRVVVASPGYLARHGYPRTPADLAAHSCVVRTFGPEGDAWPLTLDGNEIRTRVSGALRCDDAASANAAVIHGAGIGLAPLWQVRPELDQGRLEIVLPGHEPPPVAVHAVWPGTAGLPARTKLFLDLLLQRLGGERI